MLYPVSTDFSGPVSGIRSKHNEPIKPTLTYFTGLYITPILYSITQICKSFLTEALILHLNLHLILRHLKVQVWVGTCLTANSNWFTVCKQAQYFLIKNTSLYKGIKVTAGTKKRLFGHNSGWCYECDSKKKV